MASPGPGAPDTLPLRPAISKGGEGEDAVSPRMGAKAGKGMSLLFCVLSATSSLR
jgi:hypothetical protein